MQFEIVNPSDPYTMTAPDLEVAAVAVSFLGNGAYPLKGIGVDVGVDVPPFIFGRNPDEWFAEKFGMDFAATADHALNRRTEELAQTLDSVTLQRAERSSMNDIGGRAKALAIAVRRHTGSNVKVTGAPATDE